MTVADPQSPFSHQHRVRYHETDPQQFVFNSRYLEYADVAMTEFFRHLGWSYPQMLAAGFDPSLVTTTLTFSHPARLDDLLDIAVRCGHLGTSSFTLQFDLTDTDGRQVCGIRTTYVNVDATTARPTPVPPQIAAALRTNLISQE